MNSQPSFPQSEISPATARKSFTRLEGKLLRYLSERLGCTVSRHQLLAEVWHLNPERVLTRTVDMHIAKLRHKLQQDSLLHHELVTVRGEGYMCIPKDSAES